jgi:hypothetical protein
MRYDGHARRLARVLPSAPFHRRDSGNETFAPINDGTPFLTIATQLTQSIFVIAGPRNGQK